MHAVSLIVLPIPLAAAVLSFLLRRAAKFLILTAALGMLPAVGGLIWQIWQRGPQPHLVGGWDV